MDLPKWHAFFPFRTMHRKYTSMKKALSKHHRHVDRDPSNPDFQTIASRYQSYDPERSKMRMQKREEKLK